MAQRAKFFLFFSGGLCYDALNKEMTFMKLMPSTNLFYDIFNEAFDLPVLNNTIMKTDITDTNGNVKNKFKYNERSC